MSTAAALTRAARNHSNLSQRELAVRASIAQPNIAAIESGAKDATSSTLEHLLSAAGHQLIAVPNIGLTAAAAAHEIRGCLSRNERPAAFRWIIRLSDSLAAAEPAVRVALCITEPAPTGDLGWDGLLAALVEHHLASLPVPLWTSQPSRFPVEPWYPELSEATREYAREESPPAFRRHRTFLAASELASV